MSNVNAGGIRMSNIAVQEILDKVELLSDEEQFYLARRLAEKAEADWRLEADAARRIAREKGLEQSSVDQAVEEVRYPV
jgi:hypothetical protein